MGAGALVVLIIFFIVFGFLDWFKVVGLAYGAARI